MWEKQVKIVFDVQDGNFLQMIQRRKKVKIVKRTCTYNRQYKKQIQFLTILNRKGNCVKPEMACMDDILLINCPNTKWKENQHIFDNQTTSPQ